MTKKAKFYCESCGAEVDAGSSRCPSCGSRFYGVQCPRCGYAGPSSLFVKGCPSCGYLAPSQKGRESSLEQVSQGSSPRSLPAWFYLLITIILLGALGLLTFLYYRL
ncbi:double zinc ribbon domain-containing protein [Sediminispirochaeta bajacaliforniensis]|uniref:double zinc ribbon domain-containing protein n=1 Tax=Sediminispirochaeta bajacaliforniensis TaxID=148 RepID=UPI000370236B|nr:zinc ribbon domain-containing protein [Sediminispirochaeta bajacaliforniensis]